MTSRLLSNFSRTNIVFSIAGFLFALACWSLAIGATSKTESNEYQFDAVGLLPGALGFICLFLLNCFCDRTSLTSEGWDVFNVGSARPKKFFIFANFTLSLVSVGMALVLGVIRYMPVDFTSFACGIVLQTTLYTACSWTIFFGRRIEDSFF